MRHAIYYDDHRRIGRNDGAPLYVWNVLKNQLGLDVSHLLPDERRMDGYGKFDLHWWVDWGEDALKGVLDYQPMRCPSPSVYWTSDTHLGFNYRLEKAREFDHVFCMQKRAVEEFKRAGIRNPIWMPHAFEPQAYPRKVMIPKYDVCFVGHVNSENRIDFLDRMFREFPNFFYGRRLFEECADIYCQSKIVLNVSIQDDLNMRVFEALGAGSFLLTNDLPTLQDVFQDGVHLVTYKNLDDAVEKARYYLTHDEERQKIAQAGYQEVMSKHTYKHRILSMLNHVAPEWAKKPEEVACP